MVKFNKANKNNSNKMPERKNFNKKAYFITPNNKQNRKSFDKPLKPKNEIDNESERLYLKGRHEVIQALESGQSLNTVYISSAVKGVITSQIKELASKANIPVKEMSPDIFEKKFGEKTQGVAAEAASFEYSNLDEIIERAEEGHQVLVALNQVEDARNLGAIVRTVEAMGCDGVIIPKHRSAGMTEWAVRTAQGASAWLPVARVNNLCEALEDLKKAGYWVTGLDGSANKQLGDVKYDSKVVLVAGGEDVGLGERVKKACDDVVKIPMSGRTPSLNVSVSVAMAIYEILRQKNFFK
jgi:23S rRNA (guanosine2251-2'-O)-methyltransferase